MDVHACSVHRAWGRARNASSALAGQGREKPAARLNRAMDDQLGPALEWVRRDRSTEKTEPRRSVEEEEDEEEEEE